MYPIQGETQNLIAWLHSNIIISVDEETVLAVILGNCVFSRNKSLIGKLIHNKIYLSNGKIIGSVSQELLHHQFNEEKILREAWAILSQIKEHNCQWIEDSNKWDKSDFNEHFMR